MFEILITSVDVKHVDTKVATAVLAILQHVYPSHRVTARSRYGTDPEGRLLVAKDFYGLFNTLAKVVAMRKFIATLVRE